MCFVGTGTCGGIFVCFLFRNQAVLPTHHRFKLTDVTIISNYLETATTENRVKPLQRNFIIICVCLNLIFMTPSMLMAAAYGDAANGEQFLREVCDLSLIIELRLCSCMCAILFVYGCVFLYIPRNGGANYDQILSTII